MTPSSLIHLVWDWNGTLKDDVADLTDALNASLAVLGTPPLSTDAYRAQHRLPVRDFYADLLGRPLTDTEWALAETAWSGYLRGRQPRLRPGVKRLLENVPAQGHTQSLLSLSPQHMVENEVDALGLGHLFTRIEGRHTSTTTGKASALAEHLAALGLSGAPDWVVVIGDSLDDAHAAQACGARPVLVTGGLHGLVHENRQHVYTSVGSTRSSTGIERFMALGSTGPCREFSRGPRCGGSCGGPGPVTCPR